MCFVGIIWRCFAVSNLVREIFVDKFMKIMNRKAIRSFGAFVQTRVAERLAAEGRPAQRLVLVGTAAGYVEGSRQYAVGAVAPDTLIIHGSSDETVPLSNVLAWAEPLELPVVVVPGADHFFHRRLHLIRDIVTRAWHP